MSNSKVRMKTKIFREILARKNISQNGLGRVIKLTSGHVSQLIRGTRNPSPETRKKILKELDVTFDQIFRITDGKRR